MEQLHFSTPSRICLFGEHQDYLGLEVIASAINLRFSTTASKRSDNILHIAIRDESISELGAQNTEGKYQHYEIDLSQPIVYDKKRDYFKSIVNNLRRQGFDVPGADIVMDSQIPIGKGMCSSTTMVLVLTQTLAYLADPNRAGDPAYLAKVAWDAEVAEFGEPGGMMDHYTSALGGLVHLDFSNGTKVEKIGCKLNGCFILFDSLQQKDTLKVLGDSKYPTLEALEQLGEFGISSIRDFYRDPGLEKYLDQLDAFHRRKVVANINDYRIQREALAMLQSGSVDDEKLGALLSEHHYYLGSGGLGISTPIIDGILEIAKKNGAYGGKFNGSGGGGCLYVYAPVEKADEILLQVKKAGYPGMVLTQDRGLGKD